MDYDAEKDVALLKLEKATDLREPLLLREPEEAMLGSVVYAVGYPLAADITIQAVTSFSKDDATVTTGSVSRFLTESGTGRRLIQTHTLLLLPHGGRKNVGRVHSFSPPFSPGQKTTDKSPAARCRRPRSNRQN